MNKILENELLELGDRINKSKNQLLNNFIEFNVYGNFAKENRFNNEPVYIDYIKCCRELEVQDIVNLCNKEPKDITELDLLNLTLDKIQEYLEITYGDFESKEWCIENNGYVY